MMTLKEYLASTGTGQKAFAEQLDVDQSVVSRLARRDMRPSLDLAFRIERATGGAVPASCWVDPEKPQEAAE